MKRKTQVVALLDQLRSQDPKKRLSSVMAIKQIATAIGPARVRTEFVQYLAEFIDDEQPIVLELLNQLSDFSVLLGGEQHDKNLLPLLIGFCKTDEKKEAHKATQIIQRILPRNRELILQVVKKLNKVDMNTSKQAALVLSSHLVGLVPQQQAQLLQIYSTSVGSQNPAYKILAAKSLYKLLQSVTSPTSKQEIGRMLEYIYNDDTEDLPKIFALPTLITYYGVNPQLSMAKLKNLLAGNSWRVNIKLCEIVGMAAGIFSKSHFKATFETSLLKFLASPEAELRCKACVVLKPLAAMMTQEDLKAKLLPLVKKLAQDPVDYVKVQVSKNIVPLIEAAPMSIIHEQILPLVFSFIKHNELAVGIVQEFDVLARKVAPQIVEEKVLQPLMTQFNTDNWRVKCKLIELLANVASNPTFLTDKLAGLMVQLAADKIHAVRDKAMVLVIGIILGVGTQQNPLAHQEATAQWCNSVLIPKLLKLRESNNYVHRQIMLIIIEKTYQKVSEKTLNDVYKPTMAAALSDKIPNVRARALKMLKVGYKKLLSDRVVNEKQLEKLKADTDLEVRELASTICKVV